MRHNNSPLVKFPIFETSATALRGTTGAYVLEIRTYMHTYITLHCIALHCITLDLIRLDYITLLHVYM